MLYKPLCILKSNTMQSLREPHIATEYLDDEDLRIAPVFDYHGELGIKDVIALCKGLVENTNLISIDLSNATIKNVDDIESDFFRRIGSLNVANYIGPMEIDNELVTLLSVAKLLECIKKSNVTSLNLADIGLLVLYDDLGIKMCQFLKECLEKLTGLDLSEQAPGPLVECIFSALKDNPPLQHLRLANCGIDGIDDYIFQLNRNTTLLTCDLSGAEISPEAATYLASILDRNLMLLNPDPVPAQKNIKNAVNTCMDFYVPEAPPRRPRSRVSSVHRRELNDLVPE